MRSDLVIYNSVNRSNRLQMSPKFKFDSQSSPLLYHEQVNILVSATTPSLSKIKSGSELGSSMRNNVNEFTFKNIKRDKEIII